MQRALFILVAAGLFSMLVTASLAPTKPAAQVGTAKYQTQDVVSPDGLHMAVPNSMGHFPAELLPQP